MPSPIDSNYKQFSLETARLENIYKSLEDQISTIKGSLEASHTKLYGKVAELDFITHYLGAILEHISQGILFVDLSGVVTTYNPSAEAIFGIESSKVLFHSIKDLFSDDFLGFSLKEALSSKQCPKHSSIVWNKSKGAMGPQDLEVEAAFITTNSPPVALSARSAVPNVIQGLLILVRDVTEVKQLQIQAQRHDRLKDLGEMAARLAHEVRNPLGSISGFASLLLQDLKDQPHLKNIASQIIEGTAAINTIVTNILTHTRAVHPDLKNIDIISLLRDLINKMKIDSQQSSNINYHLETGSQECCIPLDASLIKSSVLNLLINASEAMPHGGDIVVEFSLQDSKAVIKVKDGGTGIAQENLRKIFNPFFTTKEKGNGLGLAEIHKNIQAHNGTIAVSSSLNEGTEFTIILPAD